MRSLRLTAIIAALTALPAASHAQLVGQTVTDNVRVCSYYGSDANPDGQVVPRTYTVSIGQDCPATAPYRDPNAAVPPNAMLTGERTGSTDRTCQYEEGGLQYQVTVALAVRCAMTPALLAQDHAGAR